MTVQDTFQRPLRNLRLSVTDRCNLRCAYCMPEEEYAWLPKDGILSFEEIGRLVEVFAGLGVNRLRLTGGEPLLRRDLSVLVRMLAAEPGIRDLAMTTNGLRLAERAAGLREAGLHRLTVSLDTLRPERFESLTRRTGLDCRNGICFGKFRNRFKPRMVILPGSVSENQSDTSDAGTQSRAQKWFLLPLPRSSQRKADLGFRSFFD